MNGEVFQLETRDILLNEYGYSIEDADALLHKYHLELLQHWVWNREPADAATDIINRELKAASETAPTGDINGEDGTGTS